MDLLDCHLPPRVDIKEVVSAAFIACCLFTGSHSWRSRDPYSLLFVIPDANQIEDRITKRTKTSALPPVSVVQLCSRCHLQDVADICVEHVEQNVVLVTIQLYWRKLFSYRRVCEVPVQNCQKLNHCVRVLCQLTHAERGSQCPVVYMGCLPRVPQRLGKDSPENVKLSQSCFLSLMTIVHWFFLDIT